MAEISVYKLDNLPATGVPNGHYYTKGLSDTRVKLHIADNAGTLFPVGLLSESDVLSTLLAGYSVGANTAIDSNNSVLQAFQKIQGQINSLSTAVSEGIKTPLPLDASLNPNYPAATAGDSYRVTVAGRVGGAAGAIVSPNDMLIALTTNGGGTEAAVGSQWTIVQANVDNATESVNGLTRIATSVEVDGLSEAFAYLTPLRAPQAVRLSPLTGYSVGANSAIVATDTVLGAFAKVQAQINSRISGTVSDGQVVFGTGANSIGGDSGFVWDNTNKRLGIAISAPLSRLDIGEVNNGIATLIRTSISTTNQDGIQLRKSTVGGRNWLHFKLTDIGNFRIGQDNNDVNYGLSFYANTVDNQTIPGTLSLYLATNGNVGIRTGAPTESFDVNGTARIRSVANATGDYATFSSTGVLQKRTLAETKTDLGISTAVNGTGLVGQVAFWNGVGSITGSDGFVWSNTNKELSLVRGTSGRVLSLDFGGTGGWMEMRNAGALIGYLGQATGLLGSTFDASLITLRSQGALGFATNGANLRWEITTAGILQSIGAQTIQTSSGNLTLQGNGGNVGIGTTTPQALFTVKQLTNTIAKGISLYNSNNLNYLHLWVDDSSNSNFQSGSNLGYKNISLNALGGNVGIGTNSPAAKLQVGDALSTGAISTIIRTTTTQLLVGQSGGNTFGFTSGSTSLVGEILNTLVVGTIAAAPLVFGTGNLERSRISATGNFLIGNTDGTDKLDVNGTVRVRSLTNTAGDFITKSATGVLQYRTASQVRTDIGAQTARTIEGSNSIEVTNGDGVAGNPIIKMKYASTPEW